MTEVHCVLLYIKISIPFINILNIVKQHSKRLALFFIKLNGIRRSSKHQRIFLKCWPESGDKSNPFSMTAL